MISVIFAPSFYIFAFTLRGFHMKNLTIIGLLIFVLSIPGHASGQYDKFKALYLYNFTKRIDWPEKYKEGDFVMGVLGKTNITKHLKDFTKNKRVLNQPIKVENFTDYREIDTCHLLLITRNYSGELNKVIEHLAAKPTLVVTEKPGSPACINFKETKKALQFQINPRKIKEKNMKVSQSLINLGIEIETDA